MHVFTSSQETAIWGRGWKGGGGSIFVLFWIYTVWQEDILKKNTFEIALFDLKFNLNNIAG